VRVAGLLVAIRIKLIGLELGGTRDDDAELGDALRRATALCAESWGEYRSGVECASAIAGDGAIIDWVLSQGERWIMSGPPPGPADPARLGGARRRKLRRKRASWQAAYNAACLYTALAAEGLADQRPAVSCLRQTVDSQHSEMERPSDWMERDPDLAFLAGQRPGESSGQQGEPTPFTRFLDAQKRLDYPAAYLRELTAEPQPQPQAHQETHPRLPEQRQQTPPVTLRGPDYQPVTGDALGAHITTMHD
jgi:hypothetical protein